MGENGEEVLKLVYNVIGCEATVIVVYGFIQMIIILAELSCPVSRARDET